MAEYRLTQRARADLIDIYDFTVVHSAQDIRPQLFE
jgi:plasmid stabilization system protein ParE